MAKKLTKSKARKILHDKEVHGHPLTEQQRKFFGAIAGGAKPYKAQAGVKTCPPGFVNIEGKCFDKASDEYKALYKYGIGYMDDEDTLVSSRMELPEVVLKPKSVLDFLDKINLSTDASPYYGGGANRYAFDQLGKKYGFIPNVKILKEQQPSELEKLLFDIFDSPDKKRTLEKTAHYIPFIKTAYVNNMKDYIAELSHHIDPLVDNPGMFLITDLPAIINQKDRYKTKGTSEYRAHEEIQPKLEEDYKKYRGEYWNTNVFRPRYMDTNDPLLRKERMDRVWDNYVSPVKKKKDGGWLDKYDAPQAQNGIEGTMGGLTDAGFNYNGAWGGTMQMGGVLPGAVGFTYARTAGAAPANGPYAKKTKASAQDGEEVMKGREFVEKWMNSPMYKQMLEKSAQGPELERINTGRISNLSVPTNVSTDISLHGTGTLGQKQHRIRTMFNATVPEREEMIKILQAAVDNPKDKEAKRKADQIMQPVVTGWNIGMNPVLKPGTLDYEATLAHEHGHTTDDPFVSKLPHQMSKKELMSQDLLPYIPKSDIAKMQSYYQGKVNDDLTKYVSKPQETRQYLTSLRYLGKTQGVYDPFTEKITPEQYRKIKPTELSDPAGMLRNIYTDEQIIDMLNSISRTQRANGVPVAQNGQEMKYYQEGLDFTPKTISKNGGWLDKYEKAQTGISTGPDPFVTARAMSALRQFAQQNTPVPTLAKPDISPLALKQRQDYMSGVGRGDMPNYPQQIAKEQQKKVNIKAAEKILEQKRAQEAAPKQTYLSADNRSELEREEAQRRTQEILWRQHLQNHPFVRTMASSTPGGNPAVGLIGAENTRDLITGVPQSASNLVGFATGQNVYGDNTFDKVTGVGLDLLSVGAGAASMVPGKQISNLSKLTPQASAQSSSLIKPFLKSQLDDALVSSARDFRLGVYIGLGELGNKSGRSFSEIFPITKAQRQKAVDVAKQAHAEGDAFARSWFYDPAGNIRPDVEGKIIDILRSKGSPLEGSRYYPNYKTLNDLRYTINTPTGPSYFITENPVGETKSVLLGSSMKSINKASGNTAFAPQNWKYPLTANRNLYPLDPSESKYLLENKHTLGGVNFGGAAYAGPSVTLMGHGPFYYHPYTIRHLASHEMGHTLQNIGATKAGVGGFPGDFTSWNEVITSGGGPSGYGYYIPNYNTELGKRFGDVMVPPIKGKRVWEASPAEVHSDLMGARANVHKELMDRGMSFEDAMQAVKDQTMTDDAMVDKLINTGNLNKFFKPSAPIEEKRALIRMLPATITGLGAASAIGASSQEVPQQQDGGEIPVDPMGYWNPENVGNPVIIPSNIITMEGVNQPLIGISDTGDIQYMEPGEDYEFDGEYVTEYPVAQAGRKVEEQRLAESQQGAPLSSIKKTHPKFYKWMTREGKTPTGVYGMLSVKDNDPSTYTKASVAYEKSQKREPIYVSDPKDPRLKKYQDSASLYKQTQRYLDVIDYNNQVSKKKGYTKRMPEAYPVSFENLPARGENNWLTYLEMPPYKISNDPTTGYKSIESSSSVTKADYIKKGKDKEEIQPTNWLIRGPKDVHAYPYFQKPVEPVVYRPEPEVEYKPRPRVEAELPRTSTGDLSYNLPKAPAQPSKTKKITTQKDEPERTKKTPVKDFLEDMRLRMEDRKMERKTKRGIKSQLKCFSGVCYDNEGNIVQAKDGVSVNNADAQPLKKLDQLLNFTNYNKPTKGGWLDKYN